MALNNKDIDRLSEHFATKQDVEDIVERKLDEKFDEKLKHLPTKDEFYNKMDEMMGVLRDSRDEQDVLAHRQSDHEDRIVSLEQKADIAAN